MEYPKIKKLAKYPARKESLGLFPQSPGIYIFWNKDIPIYIGKAISLKARLESYFSVNLSPKTKNMINEALSISTIKVMSELEALLLEARLIKYFQPKYNFIAKDDKHALYIKITNDKYPIIKAVRKSDSENTLAIFGPFPSSAKVYSVLRFIRKNFPYSDHKIGNAPCIYNQIGLCNPCPNTIERIGNSKERINKQKEYIKNIKIIKKVLEGKFTKVISGLEKEMRHLSQNEEYEEALHIRKQIENLKYITQKSFSENLFLENPNLLEDVRDEELKDLKRITKIQKLNRIECYDVSHISGFLSTASMVTFVKGVAEKSLYRRFRLKGSKNDDVLSMQEIAQRRIKNISVWGKPDLILVDGGKAQVNAFKKVFNKKNIPIIGVTKGRELLDFGCGPALNLIVRIRDESHRFAQKYHNLLFKKNLIKV